MCATSQRKLWRLAVTKIAKFIIAYAPGAVVFVAWVAFMAAVAKLEAML